MYVPSCLSSCEVTSGAFCCPEAEDVRRKAKFHALATGLAPHNGALSALHREKTKADHTLHYHTFHEGDPAPCGSGCKATPCPDVGFLLSPTLLAITLLAVESVLHIPIPTDARLT